MCTLQDAAGRQTKKPRRVTGPCESLDSTRAARGGSMIEFVLSFSPSVQDCSLPCVMFATVLPGLMCQAIWFTLLPLGALLSNVIPRSLHLEVRRVRVQLIKCSLTYSYLFLTSAGLKRYINKRELWVTLCKE